LRAEVAAISQADLSRRVPVPSSRDEIAQLARTMNAMLERLDRASTGERIFVADASHELRNPLAAFRTELEVALAAPERADWPQVAHDLLRRSHEMESLARDLLFLAAADDGSPGERLARDAVDLDDVALDETSRLRSVTTVRLDVSGVSAAPVRGSRDQLARLARNLLENAVTHASELVTVRLGVVGGEVHLEVADDGPGIPPEAWDRVFDRFVRLDAARVRGGTGLGLAIVASVAATHGGSVEVAAGDEGATLLVRCPPLTPDAQPDVMNVEDDSVWLPLRSMASASHEYSVLGRRKPGGTRSLVAVGGIVTSRVTTGRFLRPVSRSTSTW
jgi:signal transduction histidine kinase